MKRSTNEGRIRKNIICLREAFGETQEDLALAIGLSGPAAIGNYESGTNIPKSKSARGSSSGTFLILIEFKHYSIILLVLELLFSSLSIPSF